MNAAPARGSGALVALLVVAVSALGAVGCEKKSCEASAGPDVCLCPKGEGCTFSCPASAPRCSLDCSRGNRACAVTCGDNCSALCQDATSCEASCGARCHVACQYVAQLCDVTVGDESVVVCDGAPVCNVTCRGSCSVSCLDASCEVKCADPARCTVTCNKTGTEATVCPDGRTKVCGAGCR